MVRISESGMVFGEYAEENVFQIEKSKLHDKIGNGIKVVEFILINEPNKLNFIEARSSSPQPREDNMERFDEFIGEITDKFIHSFNLYYSGIMKRNNGYDEISNKFFDINNSEVKFKFILVIKNHKKEWLAPLSEALKRQLIVHNTIWKSEVIVINEDMAREYKLII